MPDLLSSITQNGFTSDTYFIGLGAAFICGIIAALTACYKNEFKSKSFIISLILLPAIVQTVITMVNGNIGTGVAVMGAFSLVRFRSVPGKAKDISLIFLVMTAGLACSAGYVNIALIFTAIVCTVMFLVTLIPFRCEKELELKITIPESINFSNIFDDIFKKYAKHYKLIRVKTTNMGSLYKLYYRFEPKLKFNQKDFIDEIRCRNGNLEISLCEISERGEDL